MLGTQGRLAKTYANHTNVRDAGGQEASGVTLPVFLQLVVRRSEMTKDKGGVSGQRVLKYYTHFKSH